MAYNSSKQTPAADQEFLGYDYLGATPDFRADDQAMPLTLGDMQLSQINATANQRGRLISAVIEQVAAPEWVFGVGTGRGYISAEAIPAYVGIISAEDNRLDIGAACEFRPRLSAYAAARMKISAGDSAAVISTPPGSFRPNLIDAISERL
jgi:hypothetical protein